MIIAILTTLITWTILLAMYQLLFARQTFFQWNRSYLLGSLAFGLILPWISLPVLSPAVTPEVVSGLQSGMQQLQLQVEEVIVTAQSDPGLNWWQVIVWVLLLGMLLRFMRFGYGIWQIANFTFQGEIDKSNSFWLVRTNADHLPFSFFNAIYWGKPIDIDTIDREVILRHEEVHLKQGHSWDILAIELLLIFFWWFPPLYFYKQEIRQLHEYLADAATLQNISPNQYKNLLLKYMMPGRNPMLAHAFTNFQLKKRLIMMSKQPSTRTKKLMYLAILPVVIVFMSFKPTIPQLTSATQAINLTVGDPIDEAAVKSSLAYILDRLKQNPDDNNAIALLTKQMYTLQSQYPDQSSELLNMAQKMLKECEADVYLAKVDGRILAKRLAVGGDTYDEVDKMPHMPGCDDLSGKEQDDCRKMNLVKGIYTNIKYPEVARKEGYEGMVLTRFIINKQGAVESPEILRSVPGGCDEEVLRVVNSMKFVPGEKDGKKVNVIFTLPVKFKLEGDAPKEKKDSKMEDKH